MSRIPVFGQIQISDKGISNIYSIWTRKIKFQLKKNNISKNGALDGYPSYFFLNSNSFFVVKLRGHSLTKYVHTVYIFQTAQLCPIPRQSRFHTEPVQFSDFYYNLFVHEKQYK